MSTDYGEMERQFLESLKADTGRDLAEWLEAIAAENLDRRNDIIDWLRRKGFMFSKASWLERIHNNGGRPIYAGKDTKRPQRRVRVAQSSNVVPFKLPPAAPPPAPPADPAPVTAPVATSPPADKGALDELLAKAKAYRPLANFVLAEIAKAVPGAVLSAEAAHVSISNGRPFAVLAISARELKLGLDLGQRPFDNTVKAAKLPGISSAITHMVILTDARQVDDGLRALFREAASRTG